MRYFAEKLGWCLPESWLTESQRECAGGSGVCVGVCGWVWECVCVGGEWVCVTVWGWAGSVSRQGRSELCLSLLLSLSLSLSLGIFVSQFVGYMFVWSKISTLSRTLPACVPQRSLGRFDVQYPAFWRCCLPGLSHTGRVLRCVPCTGSPTVRLVHTAMGTVSLCKSMGSVSLRKPDANTQPHVTSCVKQADEGIAESSRWNSSSSLSWGGKYAQDSAAQSEGILHDSQFCQT